jgi:sugar phosphate isomerase/epimerase
VANPGGGEVIGSTGSAALPEDEQQDDMTIQIGNQTSYRVPVSVPFEYALRNGFDAFEWFSDKKASGGWCEDDMNGTERQQVRRAGEEHGVVFSVHAPHLADAADAEGARAICNSIAFAADIGAKLVNLHLFNRHGAQAFAEALGPLLGKAMEAGVRLSIENSHRNCS